MTDLYERFYLAPLDRDPEGRLDAIMVAILDPDTLMVWREVRPGAFTELVHLDTSVTTLGNSLSGQVPNPLLLREPLRLWIGSDGRFSIDNIALSRKRTIQMDDPNDPYPFVLVYP